MFSVPGSFIQGNFLTDIGCLSLYPVALMLVPSSIAAHTRARRDALIRRQHDKA